MIKGIGTDIIEISRISEAIKKEYFLKRAFTPTEIEAARKRNMSSFLAGNFAAKEAFVKAMGTGFGCIGIKDIEVLRDTMGKPYINISDRLNVILKDIDKNQIHVSISNIKSVAIAMVVIEE